MTKKSPEQQIQMMVEGAQPHCDEPLVSAMICGHAGSMSSTLIGAVTRVGMSGTRTCDLPETVLIAVGPTTVYAFKYKPRGFKVKVKSGSEVARWPRSSVRVERGATGKISSQFTLVTDEGEVYPLEVTTAMGAAGAYELFLRSLEAPPGDAVAKSA